MNIYSSIEDIRDLLKEYQPNLILTGNAPKILQDVVFLSDTRIYDNPKWLYVSDEDSIRKLDETETVLDVLCFCEVGQIGNSKHNILCLTGQTDKAEIIGRVKTHFQMQGEISASLLKLMEATYSQLGLKHLIDVGFEIFQNPFFICDVSYKILGYTNCAIDENKLKWEHITRDEVKYDSVLKMKNDGTFEKLYTYGFPQIKSENNNMHSMGMRLTVKKKAVGHIVLFEYFRTFTETDRILIVQFAQAVADELQKEALYSITQNNISEVVMLELLERALDKDAARIRLLNHDLENKSDLHVLVAAPDKVSSNSASLYYIKRILSEVIAESIAIVYKETIVLLILNEQFFSDDKIQSAVNKILEENHFTAGISYAFNDISEIRKYFDQAMHVSKIAAKLGEPYNVFLYEDYCLYDLFYCMESSKELMDFCNPKIIELAEYDKRHNTTYIHSVYAYLKLNKDLTKCADVLCLHRNSIDYRIKKIQEILEVDFSNEEFCLSCFLSLKILAYNGFYHFYF